MFELKKAERNQVKLKILMSGTSGSGKTMSALKLARGMTDDWSKIAVIDTENSSASLYSHLGEFMHLDFEPPFSPNRYIQAIQFVEKQPNIEVIVVDSISHEWDGEGGCLEMVEAAKGGYGGNKFAGWNKVTPLHNKFIEAIKQCKKHLILTSRTKADYSMDKNEQGKTTVQKLGLKNIQREGFEYELTIGFRIYQNHYADVDKDRTNLFKDRMAFMIDEKLGAEILEWNSSGKEYITMDQLIETIKTECEGNQDLSKAVWKELAVERNKAYTQDEYKKFLNNIPTIKERLTE
jgi:hypothetical protein